MTTRVTGFISADEFSQELAIGHPGAVICYAEGVSDIKRCRSRRAALAAYYRGEVELVQRRRHGLFDYLAIKRKKVVPPYVPAGLRSMVDDLLKENTNE